MLLSCENKWTKIECSISDILCTDYYDSFLAFMELRMHTKKTLLSRTAVWINSLDNRKGLRKRVGRGTVYSEQIWNRRFSRYLCRNPILLSKKKMEKTLCPWICLRRTYQNTRYPSKLEWFIAALPKLPPLFLNRGRNWFHFTRRFFSLWKWWTHNTHGCTIITGTCTSYTCTNSSRQAKGAVNYEHWQSLWSGSASHAIQLNKSALLVYIICTWNIPIYCVSPSIVSIIFQYLHSLFYGLYLVLIWLVS